MYVCKKKIKKNFKIFNGETTEIKLSTIKSASLTLDRSISIETPSASRHLSPLKVDFLYAEVLPFKDPTALIKKKTIYPLRYIPHNKCKYYMTSKIDSLKFL